MTANAASATPAQRTQVLVVGGSPVGLLAALSAARKGLQVTVLERNFCSTAPGHATVLHASSLRLMADLGLSQELMAAGNIINRIELYIEGSHEKSLYLPRPALTISRNEFEELLLKEVRKEEVDIRFPCEAITLTSSNDSVQVRVLRREHKTLAAPDYDQEWEPIESSLLDADFVIGADGYESRVRAGLGIDCETVGSTQTFAMFEGPRATPGSIMNVGFQRGLGSVALPLPDQRGRWGFQIGSDFSALPDIDHLHALLAERAPWQEQPPDEIDWSTTTQFTRRLARSFGSGRTWLAGDAAHVTSPFGAQSMNVGLSEAHELVSHMADCVFDGRSPATLEQLATMREREWHKLLGFNVHFEAASTAAPWVREYARLIIPTLPASGADLQHLLEQLGLTVR